MTMVMVGKSLTTGIVRAEDLINLNLILQHRGTLKKTRLIQLQRSFLRISGEVWCEGFVQCFG
jgi:hypothetical protein